MHGGGYDGLVSLALVVLIGVVCLVSFLIYVVASKEHSIHGVRGAALYLMVAVLLVSLAASLDNALWDVLSIRNRCVTIGICVAAAYLLPLAFLRRLYRKENRSRTSLALLVCSALLAGLLIVWYVAENAI